MLLKWILDSNPKEGYLPSALEATGAVRKPKQFALHRNTQVCCCWWIIKHFGFFPCAVLFNVYLKSNGAGMRSVCLGNDEWQRSVGWTKQRKSIYFSSHHLLWAITAGFHSLLNFGWTIPSWSWVNGSTVKTSAVTCSFCPSSLSWSGSSDVLPPFFRCWDFYMLNQTADEWHFPSVQVLGKNYLCLF